jgi:uncharacterized protein (TIGR04222 family)
MGDTWGIPGPAFVVYFIIAMIVLSVAASVHRKSLFKGREDTPLASLDGERVAYLNDGEKRAVYTSLTKLTAAGAVTGGQGDRKPRQAGPLPAGATPLDVAVYNAAGREVHIRNLHTDQWVVDALAGLRRQLEDAGLAVSENTMRIARLWFYAGVAMAVLLVARFFAGVANDKPVGFLLFCAVAVVVGLTFLWPGKRIATDAGKALTSEIRYQNRHLNPTQKPSYATYGAAGAAMGVAIFGVASLWDVDPAFASEMEIEKMNTPLSTGGSSSSCSSGGGDSGGSSCGGGCGGGGCGG